MIAAENGCKNIVQLFIERCRNAFLDENVWFYKPLHVATLNGRELCAIDMLYKRMKFKVS